MSSALQLQLKARVVPTDTRMTWVNARKAIAPKGGLPSHVLLDDCLLRSNDWKSFWYSFPLWSSQVLVHPALGGVFKREESITDARTGLIFPAAHIPESAFDTPKTGLLVLLGELKPVADGVAIEQPLSILVVHGLVEQNEGGRVDEASRLPLALSAEETHSIQPVQMRFLWRTKTAGVGPLYRDLGVDAHRDDVHVCYWPDHEHRIAYAAYDILDGKKTLAEGVSLADMHRLAQGASGSELPEALRTLGSEQLEAARWLAIDAKL